MKSASATLLITLFWLAASPVLMAQQQADFSITSAAGTRIEIFSQLQPLQINRMHSWHLQISDSQGAPVQGADITVTGGMPEHDHGLPTAPRVTSELAPGRYLLEGVRLHMPGYWEFTFVINTGERSDSLQLDFEL